MADRKELGISLRFMANYVPDTRPSMLDQAWALVCHDDREDVTVPQKLADALAFLKSRIH